MLIHDGLVKRKAYLDAIMEGLDMLNFKRVMCANPNLCLLVRQCHQQGLRTDNKEI